MTTAHFGVTSRQLSVTTMLTLGLAAHGAIAVGLPCQLEMKQWYTSCLMCGWLCSLMSTNFVYGIHDTWECE